MVNNFKARIRKWANLTQQDLANLLRWGGSPNSNPNTLVCSASAGGETIAFMASEAVFVVTNYALKPGTAVSDLEAAGNAIDAVLAVEAQRVGVGRFLIALPEGCPAQPEEKTLRYVERRVPQVSNTKQQILGRLPDEENSPITSTWIN